MKCTIAHVEDHPLMRKLLGIYFYQEGYQMSHEAGNGAEFLARLKNASTLPDVCLLDLKMPVMDGFETARHLRALYPSIKILAYSGDDMPKTVESAIDCGAHGFISKDLAPEQMQKGVMAVFNNQPFIEQHPMTIKVCGGKKAMFGSAQVGN